MAQKEPKPIDLDYTPNIIDIKPLGVVFIDLFSDMHIKFDKIEK
jgi:hypothetical protein